jgi:hypothetical protein
VYASSEFVSFKETVENLQPTENESVCGVAITVDHDSKLVSVKFGFKIPDASVGDVSLTTGILMIEDSTMQSFKSVSSSSLLSYICSNNNGCDRQFTVAHFKWLLDADYQRLMRFTASQFMIAGQARGIVNLFRDSDELLLLDMRRREFLRNEREKTLH